MASDSGPWLTDDQQRAWRSWLALRTALPAALNRQLQRDSGLSLTDYDVLVALSESEGQRLRVGDLAADLDWERSRVSHHVARMAKRALVAREECEDDGRGAWVARLPPAARPSSTPPRPRPLRARPAVRRAE